MNLGRRMFLLLREIRFIFKERQGYKNDREHYVDNDLSKNSLI